MTPHHSVEGPFLALLVLAHLQAIVVAWALALASARGLPRLRERLPAGSGTCLGLAFAAFGLAALAETLDHTTTRWLYVNHTSPWNALFFTGLAAGIALLNASGDQLWHLFIGPAGSLSLLVLWAVLRQAEQKPRSPLAF